MTAGIDSADVLIVGGGIIGCFTARELAQRGLRVIVLERDQVGVGASSRNSGMVRVTGRELDELPLIRDAIMIWTQLALLPGVRFDYVRAGGLWVASNEAELAGLEAVVEREARAGLRLNYLVDAREARRLLPGLGDFVVGGIYSTMDGHLNQVAATEVVGALAREAGVEIRAGVTVEAIERQAGAVCGLQTSAGRLRAPIVLLAAGVWSPPLARTVDRILPVAIRRGQALRTRPLPHITDFGLIAPQPTGGHVAIRQLRNGAVTISGYQRPEFVGYDQEPTEQTQRLNREAAERALPCLAGAEIEVRWAGLNEQSLDTLPLLGPDPRVAGLFIATGFSGHGFGIAPGVGRLMAALIATGQSDYPTDGFRVDRFDHLDVEGALNRLMELGQGGMWVGKEQQATILGQG